MASTIVQPVLESLAGFLEGITLADGTAVKGYSLDPGTGGLDSLPGAIVALPSIRRTDPDEAESQMGSDDWEMEIPVTLAVDLSEAVFAQEQILEMVELFIRAVDADPSFGDPTISDGSVVRDADPAERLDERRPLLMYECRVLLTKLVPDP